MPKALLEATARLVLDLPARVPVRGDARYLKDAAKVLKRPDGTISREELGEAWDAYVSQFGPDVVVKNTLESVIAAGGFGHEEIERYLGRAPSTFLPDVAVTIGLDETTKDP